MSFETEFILYSIALFYVFFIWLLVHVHISSVKAVLNQFRFL